MKNFSFLFWAYNTVWILLAAYVTYLFVRMRRAEEALHRLTDRIGRNPAEPD